jgi:ABC-2 type transport system ATP-binding protein
VWYSSKAFKITFDMDIILEGIMAYAIETQELTRLFKTKSKKGKKEIVKALDHANLKINEGELFGLLGPNGAGKTTLIKILSTLLLPTSGDAWVNGHSVKNEAHKIRKEINMVSGGETSGYGLLTVRENIWMFSQFYGIPSKIAKRRIDELLVTMDLSDKANAKVRTLSTGERQKMNLVRGFVTDPTTIFLDEPTLGLDVNVSRQIRSFIRKWVREHTPNNLKRTVGKDSTIRLEVSHMSQPKRFAQMQGIKNFSYSHDHEKTTTTLNFIIEDEAVVSDIMSEIVKNSSKIYSLRKTEPTLEDVFVSLVGRGLK